METASAKAETMTEHFDCVKQAAVGAISATCGVKMTPAAADKGCPGDGVIVAAISLVGDVEWSVFLGLPRSTATAVAARFAGFEIPFDSPDMGDAIGELTNIFAGQVKAILDARGIKAEMSLPNVMRAESLQVLAQRGTSAQNTCFDSPLGMLWTGVVAGRPHGLSA